MKEVSNLQLPYNYEKTESFAYTFQTISGVKYTAYFIEMEFFESCNLFSFSFEKEGDNTYPDNRISETIIQILKDFFECNIDAILFTCDTYDGRHRARKILFDKWFMTYSNNEYIKFDKSIQDIHSSIIVAKNNPLEECILLEFEELINAING